MTHLAALVRTSRCPGCGDEFEHAGLQRIFCSDACRARAALRRAADPSAVSYERACAECSARFQPSPPTQALCSDTCRQNREARRDRDRAGDVVRVLGTRARCASWAAEHRGVTRSNPWLAGAPPYDAHLHGAAMSMTIEPHPKWPIHLRNTRALHGMLTQMAGPHLPHAPRWALVPSQSGWGVYWYEDAFADRATQAVPAVLFDKPVTVRFGPAFRFRSPRITKRGRRRLRIDAVTPVVTQSEGASRVEVPTTPSLTHAIDGMLLHRIAPSPEWRDYVRARIRLELVDRETIPEHVPLGGKYGLVRGWSGHVVVEVNAVAHWLLVACERMGLGAKVAFGFGRIRVSEVP